MLTGVVCIPNKQIYRKNENGDEYFVYFSSESIEKMRDRFMKSENNRNINLEHDTKLENHYITEMWIVDNPEIDKAKHLGFNVPKGTLMASVKVDNSSDWESLVLNGKVTGFSLEGQFNHKQMENKEKEKQEFSNSKGIVGDIIDFFVKKDRIKALTDGRKVAQKQMFNHAGETINIMPNGIALKVSNQTLQASNASKGVLMMAVTDGKYINSDNGEVIEIIDGIAYMAEEAVHEVWTIEGLQLIINPDGTVLTARGNSAMDGVYTLEDGTTIEVVGGLIVSKENEQALQSETPQSAELTELKTQFASQSNEMKELKQMLVQLTQVIQTTTKAQTPNVNADLVPTESKVHGNFSENQLRHREELFKNKNR
jgi:hypothetical protein